MEKKEEPPGRLMYQTFPSEAASVTYLVVKDTFASTVLCFHDLSYPQAVLLLSSVLYPTLI